MSETYDEFLASIVRNLEKHGYPGVKVSLPLDRMYEVAYEKGLNFNKALAMLDERGIAHEKTSKKIIFFPKVEVVADTPSSFEVPPGFNVPPGFEEMLRSVTPEQLAAMQEMVARMSPEEREELMRKARDMGIV